MMNGPNRQKPSCPKHNNKLCVNSNCPFCFPTLSYNDSKGSASSSTSTANTAFAGRRRRRNNNNPSSSSTSSSTNLRSTTANLIELPIILCNNKGEEMRALKSIRCDVNDQLSQIRSVLSSHQTTTTTDLPNSYSFLRESKGHVVLVDKWQESGNKAFKAKHFVKLCICRDDDNNNNCYNNKKQKSVTRESSAGVIDFQVRQITSSLDYEQSSSYSYSSSIVLGTIRLHQDLSISNIRKEMIKQLPDAPTKEARFARRLGNDDHNNNDDNTNDDIFPITMEQEKNNPSLCIKHPLRAKSFAPPHTPTPEIILLVPSSSTKFYRQEDVVEDETKHRELKSLKLALQNQNKNPCVVVKEKAIKYINAFLNSSCGGVLIFGVDDDGVVERVPISGKKDDDNDDNDDSKYHHPKKRMSNRIKEARHAKDHIRKLVDYFVKSMDPPVESDLVTTLFVPVRVDDYHKTAGINDDNDDDDEITAGEDEIYCIIEIHVKPRRGPIHFIDVNSFEAYERRDGSTFLMDKATALQHSKKGWRHLQSAFDFTDLMRRWSDPWAGREWLFAAVRRSLFALLLLQQQQQEQQKQNLSKKMSRCCCCHGVAVTGNRGQGKTSFLSELTLRPESVTNLEVVAHHFCRGDDPDTLNPSLFVHSIAAMLTESCKEYRKLMSSTTTSSTTTTNGDSMGASMLRALDQENCERDPDDAFLRGIMEPLRLIESNRQEKNKNRQSMVVPSVIVVDALDECLAITTERRPGQSGSTTVAHLLERAFSGGRALPPWIKLVVSFRMEILDVPGPIQRLAHKLDIIQLEHNPSNSTNLLNQAQNDIRMFIQAYVESTGMTSLCGKKGSGSWNFAKAAAFAKKLQIEKYGHMRVWQYEETPAGKWIPFNDTQQSDLMYAYEIIGDKECSFFKGKHLFIANFKRAEMKQMKKSKGVGSGGGQKIRLAEVKSDGKHLMDLEKSFAATGGVSTPNNRVQSHIKIDADLIKKENDLLDILACNSQGNYLYARSVLEDIRSGRLQWDEIPSVPCGLDHLYNNFFKRYKSVDIESKKLSVRAVQPVLEVLLAAPRRGITERNIIHAVVSGGACDPASVAFCLRDIQWALDVDNSGDLPRYQLRHESIREFLRHGDSARIVQCQEENGHTLLAASLIQRCWPQQRDLSRWLQSGSGTQKTTGSLGRTSEVLCEWYQWSDWEPNTEDEDIYNLVVHLTRCNAGSDEERISLLKTIGLDLINSVYRSRSTPLHSAAYFGNIAAVKLLLAANASPNIAAGGRCPLHLAASKGFSETVSLLLDAGASVSSVTVSGLTPLLCAASRGSESTARYILEAISDLPKRPGHEDVDEMRTQLDASSNDTGRTSLSLAAEGGHEEIIKLLLDKGASVALADRSGRTPLYYAAQYGRVGPTVVQALVAAKGGKETLGWGECSHLRSPLHIALREGQVEIVRALLGCGADPNIVDYEAHSALHEAVYFGRYGCGYGRKQNKLTISTNDDQGEGGEDDDTAIQEKQRLEILQLILKHGHCQLNQGDVHGCTPLWYAARDGWTEAVGLLLDAGASIDPGDLPHLPDRRRGGPTSPLLFSIHRGDYDMAFYLLDKNARLPAECNVGALCSEPGFPPALAEALKSMKANEINHKSKTGAPMSQQIVDYTSAVKCKSVPREAFARAPQNINI